MDPATLDSLLKTQPAVWRGRDRYTCTASIPTGFAALDNALPANGWSIGGVTELLVEQHGIGELSLLLPALRHVAGRAGNTSPDNNKTSTQSADIPGWAALINPPHIPYAPAFSNAGIALNRLLIVNTGTDINTLWATEQVLRSGLFGAVVAWVQKSSAQRQRRLQLAAEAGGSWAVVYRPLSACKEHSPVSTRICITLGNNHPQSNHPQSNLSRGGLPRGGLPQDNHPQQLTLDIIKLRAGSPQIVTISPEEFDASQGSEWPVPKPAPALRGASTTSPTALRSLSGMQYISKHSEKHDAVSTGIDSTDH